jgi:hypothetical protein
MRKDRARLKCLALRYRSVNAASPRRRQHAGLHRDIRAAFAGSRRSERARKKDRNDRPDVALRQELNHMEQIP